MQTRATRHIIASFSGLPIGTFKTIAEIVGAITPEYPDPDIRPGSAAILLCLAYRNTLTFGGMKVQFGHKVQSDTTTAKGARRL